MWSTLFRLASTVCLAVCLSAAAPPSRMLWAWERPGDLRSLPREVGVAFLAASVYLRDGAVRVVPRFQPLRLPSGAYRMAVVRIESPAPYQRFTAYQRAQAVDAIAGTLRATNADALQIDFDARVSERSFYTALIRDARAKIGRQVFLSITALVSWCGAHSWLDDLPVDEVVPMTFEMGQASASTETLLQSGGTFPNAACRASIGLALNDVSSRKRNYQRIYVFAYEDWTGPLARSVLTQLR